MFRITFIFVISPHFCSEYACIHSSNTLIILQILLYIGTIDLLNYNGFVYCVTMGAIVWMHRREKQ